MSANLFETVKRPSVTETIIENFKQALIEGRLRPGQRLPSEAELAQQIGTGRNAVREAIKMLQAMGVVEIQHGNGSYIVDKPSETLLSPIVFAIMLQAAPGKDLLGLRSLLEVGYCQLAAESATDEDWTAIERAKQAFEEYAHSPGWDAAELTRRDLEFHFALLDATHNPLVIQIGRTVEQLFLTSIRNTLAGLGDLKWAIEGHHRIVQAVRGGDPETIRQSVARSLTYWAKEVEHTDE
ncbi:MAG: FadR family transcriptional regulator [Anaerolineae bacterium]|nr:FadR family transcriptional regulator [Anaerolineae bacterium]